MEYIIEFVWDPDACAWVAECNDVPGLALEAGSLMHVLSEFSFPFQNR